jgi:hypothetical protein
VIEEPSASPSPSSAPAAPNLGRLEQVDLHSAWMSEASAFTPWLAQGENLALLGKTIGIDLEV